MTHPVLTALRSLGPGAHSARDVWWAMCVADLNAHELPSVGGVERALEELWVAEAVEQERGGWRLPEVRAVQMRLEG